MLSANLKVSLAMGKRGRTPSRDKKNPKRRTQDNNVHPEDMDDEIDACKSS